SYSYTLTDNEAHPSGGGNNNLFRGFAVHLVDSDGDSANNTLSVRIVDDVPTASSDSNPGVVSEASLVLDGNVLGNDVQAGRGRCGGHGGYPDGGPAAVWCWVLTAANTYTLNPADPQFVALPWAGRRGARCSPMC
ncbi:hypothetical protein P5G63_00035, partial [Aeromonas salmonicida]|nr:hypothetical protein [Aeromonas salmonicida]